jgi:tetratricopeptide (TPR) repeat protein
MFAAGGLFAPRPLPPSDGAVTGAALSPAATPAPLGAELAAVTQRLETLQATVSLVAEKLDQALAARQRADAPSASAADGVTVDADALQRAIEAAQQRAERAKFDAMTTGEVLSTATELTNTNKDLGKARRLLEDLLARNLTPAERQKALLQLGIAHRSGADFEQSKAVLQQAIDLGGGIDVEAGAWAAFQLAWTCSYAGDAAGARQWFERVGRSAGSGKPLLVEGRWNAAKLAAAAGDPGANAAFAAILADIDGDENFRHIAADIRARLGR